MPLIILIIMILIVVVNFWFLDFAAEWDLCASSSSLSVCTWRAGRCVTVGMRSVCSSLGPRPSVFKYPHHSGPLQGRRAGMCWLISHFAYKLETFSFCRNNKMELDRRLLLAHCTTHALSIVAGLLVVVPMALNGSAFKGRCALFSTGYWRTEDRPELTGQQGEVSHLVVQQWGPPAACQFATFVGIFTVLYGAAQGWRCLFYLHGRHDEWVTHSTDTLLT